MIHDDENGCISLSRPSVDRADVQCPHMSGANFLDDCYRLRCTGRLFRTRILDAEKDCSCCDKCFRLYGIELIEEQK